MIILDRNTFHPDECELMFDAERLPLSDAIQAFCQDVSDDPNFIEESGMGLINVMYRNKNADRHPFGIQYHTSYDKDNVSMTDFRFVDRKESEGASLIPDNIFDMQVVYLKKERQNNKNDSFLLTIVVDESKINKSRNRIDE